MKVKNYIFICLFFIVSNFAFAQEAVLCPLQNHHVKIESTADIPTVIDNMDGTITLTHQDQNITDIFADYVIYDFYQSFPNTNPDGELIKYYTIVHGNRTLINELYDYAYPDVYSMEPYPNTSISPGLINLLDNKTYKLIKYCTESTEGGVPCPEGEQNVPAGFQLNIVFTYDEVNGMMHAETEGISSCENSFSIRLRGGFDDGFGSTDNTLQLWQSEQGTSTVTSYNQPCHYIEKMLYSVLDIGCIDHDNYGNIRVNESIDETGQIILERENAFFATDFLTFQDTALSVSDEAFKYLKLFETKGNPFLQITNLNNQLVNVEIYNTSGQQIIQPIAFKENSLNISNLSNGLYFIRVSNLNNQQKIFKFLKN